jgi:hypothetical protein
MNEAAQAIDMLEPMEDRGGAANPAAASRPPRGC